MATSAHGELCRVAQEFCELVAAEDYASAHKLLTAESQAIYPPENLKRRAEGIQGYAPGPIIEVEVMQDMILDDWPGKEDKDVARIYVSLDGDGFCEAAYLTIAEDDGKYRVRELEWGGHSR